MNMETTTYAASPLDILVRPLADVDTDELRLELHLRSGLIWWCTK
jgi:hypothetical protein